MVNKIKEKVWIYKLGKEIGDYFYDYDMVELPSVIFLLFKRTYRYKLNCKYDYLGRIDTIKDSDDKHLKEYYEMNKPIHEKIHNIYFYITVLREKYLKKLDNKLHDDEDKTYFQFQYEYIIRKLDNKVAKKIIDIAGFMWF